MRTCLLNCGSEHSHTIVLQEDGTLQYIIADETALKDMIEPLCETLGLKESEESVRLSLAEATLSLVCPHNGSNLLPEARYI